MDKHASRIVWIVSEKHLKGSHPLSFGRRIKRHALPQDAMIMNVNTWTKDVSLFPLCVVHDVRAHQTATRKS